MAISRACQVHVFVRAVLAADQNNSSLNDAISNYCHFWNGLQRCGCTRMLRIILDPDKI